MSDKSNTKEFSMDAIMTVNPFSPDLAAGELANNAFTQAPSCRYTDYKQKLPMRGAIAAGACFAAAVR